MLKTLEAKIERAKEQIGSLQSEIDAFFQGHPYRVVEKRDPQTKERVFRLRISREIPPRFAVIFGEIIHDLRSSLDQLICHLIIANHHTPTTQSAFPIYKLGKEFKSQGPRKVQGAGKEVWRILKHIKPYRRGNAGLYKLHQASISEKHRFPALIGVVYRDRSYDPTAVIRALGGNATPITWIIRASGRKKFPLKSGYEIFRVQPQIEDQYDFTFDVAFTQPKVFKGEPLIPTLRQLTSATEDTLKRFDRLLT